LLDQHRQEQSAVLNENVHLGVTDLGVSEPKSVISQRAAMNERFIRGSFGMLQMEEPPNERYAA
jgi:hypothetical protein